MLLLDKQSGQVLNSYSGHRNTTYRCDARTTHDDAFVVAGSESHALACWDLLDAKLANANANTNGHAGVLTSLDTHPSKHAIVTASVDSTIRRWRK